MTRAVRVVDLITNLDMAAFQAQGGLSTFINRLEVGSALIMEISILQFMNVIRIHTLTTLSYVAYLVKTYLV